MEEFPFAVSLQVRYQDLDSFGHVNNAVYLTYLEEARVALFREALGMQDANGFNFIVARVEIDYRRPVRLFEPLRAGLCVESIGRTSYVFGYRLHVGNDQDRKLAASARSVQVCYDYQRDCKIPVPDSFRAFLARYLVAGGAEQRRDGR